MKIAIVENDAEQVVRFIGHIKKYSAESGEDCGVVAFGNGIDFLTDYSGDFDAVFMDIDMPLMDGMTAAEKLREIDENVPIVFVTNLAQYVIKGYKVQALDYLVKPVGYFEVALELKKINSLRKNMAGDFVWLTVSGAMRRIPFKDIFYVEILNHDVHVHTKSQVFTYRGTLKETEAKLAGKNFSRCHNCFIVNLHYITEVDGESIKLEDGTNLYLSRNRKKAFLADLTSYIANNGAAVRKN